MKKYTFKTAEEFAEQLVNLEVNKVISFTFDTKEELSEEHAEPSGWYGATALNIFDSKTLIVNFYGGGYLSVYDTDKHNTWADYEEDKIIEMLKENEAYNGSICIDIEEIAQS